MNDRPNQARLWEIIVQYGLEEECERDLLGRIKSKRSKRYLRAEMTPELAQALAGGAAYVGGAKAALAAAPDQVRRALSRLQRSDDG